MSGTHQLKDAYSPKNATNTNIRWSNSNASIATVSSTELILVVQGDSKDYC